MPENPYRYINYRVMTDTKHQYETDEQLKASVRASRANQFMVAQDEDITQPAVPSSTTRYIVSGKRSFEAAKGYPGKRVAVLNFANNHSIGGAPFSAGAQEESLCRCSTLFPCLEAMEGPFYRKHQRDWGAGKLDHMGNDDLIYTPGVTVFKTDERTEPIEPKMMPRDEWYTVNVITCAAPQLQNDPKPANYEYVITRRIKKILDVAAREQNQVLILGAWGCGAFKNPTDVVAHVFFQLLPHYAFETVEFALSSNGDVSHSPFAREAAALTPEKPRLYFDMDGVLVDFQSALDLQTPEVLAAYEGRKDEIPGLFGQMLPMPGAIEAVHALAEHYDCYILSTAPWKNPSAWADKVAWVTKYLDDVFHKKLILTHSKDLLNDGKSLLIDDRSKHGADTFGDRLIAFGSPEFPDWPSVLAHLIKDE